MAPLLLITYMDDLNILRELQLHSVLQPLSTSQWARKATVSLIAKQFDLVQGTQYAGVINKFYADMTTAESCLKMMPLTAVGPTAHAIFE